MPFFRKIKSIPNLYWQKEYKPHDVLKECLKLENLIKDMKREYIYSDPTNIFDAPLLSLFMKSLDLRPNK